MSQSPTSPTPIAVDGKAAYEQICKELGMAIGEVVQLRMVVEKQAQENAYLRSLTDAGKNEESGG